jgi:hypothetical protein
MFVGVYVRLCRADFAIAVADPFNGEAVCALNSMVIQADNSADLRSNDGISVVYALDMTRFATFVEDTLLRLTSTLLHTSPCMYFAHADTHIDERVSDLPAAQAVSNHQSAH